MVCGLVVRSTVRFFGMGIVLDAGVIALHQAPMRFHEPVSAFSKIVAGCDDSKPVWLHEMHRAQQTIHPCTGSQRPERLWS